MRNAEGLAPRRLCSCTHGFARQNRGPPCWPEQQRAVRGISRTLLEHTGLIWPQMAAILFPVYLHHRAFLLCSFHPGKPELQRGVPAWWFPASSPSCAFVSTQILCPRAGGKGFSLHSMGCALGGPSAWHWGNVPALCAAWAEGRMLPWVRNHPRGHGRKDFAGDFPAGCYRDVYGTLFYALHLLMIWVKAG